MANHHPRNSPNADEQRRLLARLLAHDPPSAPPLSDDELLARLLEQEPPEPARRRALPWPLLRRWGAGLLVVVLLLVVYLFGGTFWSLLRIRSNLQAMQLATPVASAPNAPVRDTPPESEMPVFTPIVLPTSQPAAADGAPLAPTDAAGAALPAEQTPRAGATATPPPTLTPLPTDLVIPPDMLPTVVAAGGRASERHEGRSLPPPGAPITVLLLGIDKRPGETFPARTDAMVVARIEPQTQRVALLSLERDLIVPIPGYGYQRINSANVLGEMTRGEGGGIDLTRRTLSSLLDTPIDYVVQVNFQGFMGAIDAIGGIMINVEHELYDPRYPTMDYGYTVAHFEPGLQHMDGERALMYSRVRHMDSNFERMRRQQAVLTAVLRRLREENILGQVQRLDRLTYALREHIQTDMSPEYMVELAWAFRDFSPQDVERYVLDETMVSMYALPDDPYAMFALPGTFERLSRQLLEGTPTPTPTPQP
jgi:LCP family protein required for cell wall assembly